MTKKKKIWLIVAICLTIFGGIVLACSIVAVKGDFTKLSTVEYETNEHTIETPFENISIISDTADVVIVASDSQTTKVVCHEEKSAKHTVSVQDNALTIKVHNEKKWYEYWFNFNSPKITVYIPQGEYAALSVESDTGDVEIPKDFQFNSINISGSTGDVACYASVKERIKIKQSTGEISLSQLSAGTIELTTSTGDIELSNVTALSDITISVSTGDVDVSDVACAKFVSIGDTGDMALNNVIAIEKLFIVRSTGEITFRKCDAEEIYIETDTGDVRGSLLSEKTFVVETDTGEIDIPIGVIGGLCKITTDTGDIKITIE